VTTSCSTANIDLCKSLGADEVLDYKSADILGQLSKIGPTFDLAIDNVGTPANLYKQSHNFLVPAGTFVQVGLAVSFGGAQQLAGNLLTPAFLGGGKRKYEVMFVSMISEDLAQLGAWMKEGKIRNVVDSTYKFDNAPNAFLRLKTGRAKGKIVVHVKKD
jgi:NADPH:quinone reductase-like Zn-dependent oxidoreductase